MGDEQGQESCLVLPSQIGEFTSESLSPMNSQNKLSCSKSSSSTVSDGEDLEESE